MDFLSSRPARSSWRTGEIRTQIGVELELDENATVMVTELACAEEGCPPIETAIAVFRPDMEKLHLRLHRPIADITAQEIHDICAPYRKTSPLVPTKEKNHGNCCS